MYITTIIIFMKTNMATTNNFEVCLNVALPPLQMATTMSVRKRHRKFLGKFNSAKVSFFWGPVYLWKVEQIINVFSLC
jgi:hypothetical protein